MKRTLSFVLALVLLIGLMPMQAFATEVGNATSKQNLFAGKKVSILGDSISTYSGISGVKNPVYPNSSVASVTDTWWKQVIDALGGEVLKVNASGGSRILSDEYFNGAGIRDGNHAAFRDRCVNLHVGNEKPDVILVFMGTNDFSYHVKSECRKCQILLNCTECTSRADGNLNVCAACRAASGVNSSFCNLPLGTADSVDISRETPVSSCEAYAIMLNKMKAAYPDAQIYCLGLLPRVNPYQSVAYHDHGQPTVFNAELKKVAENAGATFIDLEHCLDNSAATWSAYFGDAVHPTSAGMDKISEAVISGILGSEVYMVSSSISDGITLSGMSLAIAGSAYEARLDAISGMQFDVQVTMNGVDITENAYDAETGKINIDNVTGNIVITAKAKLMLGEIMWSVGAVNSTNGNLVDMRTRIRTNMFDVTRGAVITAANDVEFCPVFYDKDGKFVCSPNAYNPDGVLEIPAGQYVYMRIMARNKNNVNESMTPAYGENITVTFGSETASWSVGTIYCGDHANGSNADNYKNRIRTGFIAISEGVTVRAGHSAQINVVFYDEDFKILSTGNNCGWTTEWSSADAPAATAYIRVVAKDDSDMVLTMDYGENITVIFGSKTASWSVGTIYCGDHANGSNADNYKNRIRTGFIAISEGVTVRAGHSAQINVVFYDEDFKILSTGNNCGWTTEWSSADAPAATAYIRVVAKDDSDMVLTVDYGENITLIHSCSHRYGSTATAPTCTEQGYTTYTCACGDSYVGDYIEATGHSYVSSLCVNCGKADPDYWGTWVAFGTSITEDKDYMRPNATNIKGTYIPYLSELMGVDAPDANYSMGGAAFSTHLLMYMYCAKYQKNGLTYNGYTHTAIKNADLITIEGGVNDFYASVPLGKLGDTVPYSKADPISVNPNSTNNFGGTTEGTFAGCIYAAIIELRKIAPNATIVFITDNAGTGSCAATKANSLGYYLHDYNDMMTAVAESMGCYVIDAGRTAGFEENLEVYLSDHIHHSEAGGEAYANAIWDGLCAIANGEYTKHSHTHKYEDNMCIFCGDVNGPVITQQPESVEQEIGKKFAITVKAEGEGLRYQWYVKESGAKEFKLSSNKTSSYAYTMQTYMVGRQVYCVITDANGNSVTTETATITRPPVALKIVEQPQDARVNVGEKFSISPKVEGEGLRYQWYVKESGAKEFKLSSNKTSAYAYTMQNYMVGRQVYCVITDKYGNQVTTEVATISLPPVELKILEEPGDASAPVGTKFSVSFDVQGDGLTYQWYYKNVGGKSFAASSNKTSSYAYTMANYMDGRQVYCVITDQYGNQVTTEVITIHVEK